MQKSAQFSPIVKNPSERSNPKMQIAYHSIQNFSMDKAMRTTLSSNHDHPLDPELVC